MAGKQKVGRNWLVKKAGAVIAGLRSKELSWSGEPVDVTTDDDSGIRTLLDNAIGNEQIDMSGDGIYFDDLFADIALDQAVNKMLTDITLVDAASGRTLSGNFFLASYQETAPYQDAVSFNYSLQSSGPWVYTPAA